MEPLNAQLKRLSGCLGDIVTPPIPSSSPGPDDSHMEVTPLPHKPPYFANTSVPTDLPTPEPTPMDDDHTEPPSSLSRPELTPPTKSALGHQRRISNGTRPSLRKGYSMNQVNSKANGTAQSNQPQTFLFGPGGRQPPKPILEDFVDSPPSERKLPCSSSTSDLNSIPVPRLILCPENGSPIGAVRRNSSVRGAVPRMGLGRRTQSLQCQQIVRPMRQDKRCCTEGSIASALDVLEPRRLSLPHFKPQDEPDALPRITQETLIEVLDGAYKGKLQDVSVIDCRFEYEFDGGHINGALNFNDKDKLAGQLFDPANLPQSPTRPVPARITSNPGTGDAVSSKAIIFHCEYSHHRAPRMAQYVRLRDREHNQHQYPHLTYPEMYILEGGYASFFEEQPHRCFPQAYVEMNSKGHEEACERGMAKVRRRVKLCRAQTYACDQSLGPHSAPIGSTSDGTFPTLPMLQDSPLPLSAGPFFKATVPGSDLIDAMDLDEVMDDVDKRRSITFESPSLPLSQAGASRWLSRNSSY